jgi:hypothetical protein
MTNYALSLLLTSINLAILHAHPHNGLLYGVDLIQAALMHALFPVSICRKSAIGL